MGKRGIKKDSDEGMPPRIDSNLMVRICVLCRKLIALPDKMKPPVYVEQLAGHEIAFRGR